MSDTTALNGELSTQQDFPVVSLSKGEQIIYYGIFAITISTAIFFNFIILWIILGHAFMRTGMLALLMGISVMDILFLSLVAMFTVFYAISENWEFGEYCKVYFFFGYSIVSTRGLYLIILSTERYNRIAHPTWLKLKWKSACKLMLGLWLSCSTLSLSMLYYTQYKAIYLPRGNGSENPTIFSCSLIFTDESFHEMVSVIFMVLAYIIPALFFLVTCIRLWKNVDIPPNQKEKDLQMLAAMLLIFGVCWLPAHVHNLTFAFHYKQLKFQQHVFLINYWFYCSTCISFPIVYIFIIDSFRCGFLKLFKVFHWKKPQRPNIPSEVTNLNH